MARRKPRIGVALGAGSARGWAHIGALQALERAGVHPEIVCGTSIGALVGAIYADGMLDPLREWVTKLTWRKVVRYFDLTLRGGLLKGDKLFESLERDFLRKDIEDLQKPFGAVATDLATGREIWLRKGSVADAVRASIAMPGLVTPKRRDEQLLVDGALVNPVPVTLARATGADFVIAVDLSADIVGRFMREADEGALATPNLVEVVVGSLNIMSTRITRSRMAGEPADAVVQPRLGGIGLLEYQRGAEAIDEGRAAAEFALPQIQRALKSWR